MVHAHHPLVRRRNRFDWGKLHWPGAAENIDARNAAPEPIAGPASGVQTLVSIVYITQSKTFDGPAVYVTLGQPLVNSRTTTAVSAATTDNSDDSSDDSVTSDPTTQATAATTTAKNTSAATTAAAAATTAVTSAIGAGTTHKATGTGTSIADASATASLTPKPGMSGGAKAALVLGLLIGIALVLGLILWLYKGKKRQQAMRRLSDEKSAYNGGPRTNAFRPATAGGASMHAPPSIVVDAPGAAPSVRSMATADTAPRLELRPVTQFAPMLGSDGRQSPRPSAWEKPGAANAANDPANPFGNHAETVENGAAKNTAVFGAAAVPSTNTRSPPRGPPAPIAPIAPGFRPGGPDSPKPLSVRSNASGVPGESRETPANEGPGPQAAGPIIPTGPSGQAGPPGHPALLAAAAGTRQPPPPGPPGINNVHRVQMDFNPSMEDELRIRAGQLVRMLHEYDDGWALCIRMDRSQQGVVPRTCLSKYPVKPRPTNGGPPPAPYRNYNGPGAPPNGPPVGPPVGPNMGMRAITQGCFFNIAARLGMYTHNETYFRYARQMWEWTDTVGLISPDYEIFDGSDDTLNCSQFNHIQWTYNAGVFLYGAAVMWNSTNGTEQDTWGKHISGILTKTTANFFKDGIMYEAACEPNNNCNTDQQSFKAYLSRWMAATVKVAPWTRSQIMPLLASSAQAAAKSCSGGDDGVTCGTQWTTGAWDNTWGVGQQMNALEVIQANLIDTVRGPLGNGTGATSIGNPAAGTGGDNAAPPLSPITTGDRAGAGILTALVLVLTVGGAWWMVA